MHTRTVHAYATGSRKISLSWQVTVRVIYLQHFFCAHNAGKRRLASRVVTWITKIDFRKISKVLTVTRRTLTHFIALEEHKYGRQKQTCLRREKHYKRSLATIFAVKHLCR